MEDGSEETPRTDVMVVNRKELARFLEQCKRIEKRVFPKHEAMTASMESELKKSNTHLLVAKTAESEVLGYAIIVHTTEGSQLTKLCVKEGYRRFGIGSRLLKQVQSDPMQHKNLSEELP
mmetsp:Transcript_34627/g.54061  ORF Transcript_34627/g.54061 Transcript_34627/m.54061 type:complete len:120 (+) Transcript_34627:106-465(+)